MAAHIKSKERVANHGEVFTPEWIVNAMLDLVKQETERIESRFLEPACGTGNFLIEILRRKLAIVDRRYRRSRVEWERNGVLAVSSLYGIELLEDNCQECRDRLFGLFDEAYTARFKTRARDDWRNSIRFLLRRNIIWGDALALKTVQEPAGPIVFSQWSPVNGSLIKRKDFVFEELLRGPDDAGFAPVQASLFGDGQLSLAQALVSDRGEPVYLPRALREFPPVHYLEIGCAFAD